MRWIGAIAAVALIAAALLDAFKAVILPRRVTYGYLVRFFYRSAWKAWRTLTNALPLGRWRNTLLSVFGPALLWDDPSPGPPVGARAADHWGRPIRVSRHERLRPRVPYRREGLLLYPVGETPKGPL